MAAASDLSAPAGHPPTGDAHSAHPAGPMPRLAAKLPPGAKAIALLGPTNTGKTHHAMDRMLGHASGMIGFPLRLLARENYDKAVRLKGAGEVALITGEEKIVPPGARYFICTVESMPVDRPVAFLAIDEIQLCADRDRGHVFTQRLLSARGWEETWFLGADTMRGMIRRLVPEAEFQARPRFSRITHIGLRKLTKLPPRSAIVAFSADEVYAIAEVVRRQRGGTAVVLGALSPRTRNAQVALYQSGEVDYLVATDAIGMGLNMDLDHVAFASLTKFDGARGRALTPAELAQIAGRAGRHMADGTFGTTADAGVIDDETVEAIEQHRFNPVTAVHWRNDALDFRSVHTLLDSLDQRAPAPILLRVRDADDHSALLVLARDPGIAELAKDEANVRLLWEVCQIPDFRKTLSESHTRLIGRIFQFLRAPARRIPPEWIRGQIDHIDRIDGDIDTLVQRLAHIRTWTFVTHRADWLAAADDWAARAREVEDKLSDALHDRLTQRFVDRRAAVISRLLKGGDNLLGAVTRDSRVLVEGEYVGELEGFQFRPDVAAEGEDARALMAAARRALVDEIPARVARLVADPDRAFLLSDLGVISWRQSDKPRTAPPLAPAENAPPSAPAENAPPSAPAETASAELAAPVEEDGPSPEPAAETNAEAGAESAAVGESAATTESAETSVAPAGGAPAPSQWVPVARLAAGDDVLSPRIVVLDSDLLDGAMKEQVRQRLANWLNGHIQRELGPLYALRAALTETALAEEPLAGPVRGIAFQLVEHLGCMERGRVEQLLRAVSQDDRKQVARLGIRVGVETLYLPMLLKPRPSILKGLLRAVHAGAEPISPPDWIRLGRVSVPSDLPAAYLEALGYKRLAGRAMRVDMLERFAATARGLARNGPFPPAQELLSMAGVTHEELDAMLKALGFRAIEAPPQPTAVPAAGAPAEPSAEPATEVQSGDTPPSAEATAAGEPSADGAKPAEVKAPAVLYVARRRPYESGREGRGPAERSHGERGHGERGPAERGHAAERGHGESRGQPHGQPRTEAHAQPPAAAPSPEALAAASLDSMEGLPMVSLRGSAPSPAHAGSAPSPAHAGSVPSPAHAGGEARERQDTEGGRPRRRRRGQGQRDGQHGEAPRSHFSHGDGPRGTPVTSAPASGSAAAETHTPVVADGAAAGGTPPVSQEMRAPRDDRGRENRGRGGGDRPGGERSGGNRGAQQQQERSGGGAPRTEGGERPFKERGPGQDRGPRRDDRGDRQGGERGRERPPSGWRDPKPEVDPDSPFAKLAALKEAMQRGRS